MKRRLRRLGRAIGNLAWDVFSWIVFGGMTIAWRVDNLLRGR